MGTSRWLKVVSRAQKMLREEVVDIMVSPMWSEPMCVGLPEVKTSSSRGVTCTKTKVERGFRIFRPDPSNDQVNNPRYISLDTNYHKMISPFHCVEDELLYLVIKRQNILRIGIL